MTLFSAKRVCRSPKASAHRTDAEQNATVLDQHIKPVQLYAACAIGAEAGSPTFAETGVREATKAARKICFI
jgi:hypothetical protein